MLVRKYVDETSSAARDISGPTKGHMSTKIFFKKLLCSVNGCSGFEGHFEMNMISFNFNQEQY